MKTFTFFIALSIVCSFTLIAQWVKVYTPYNFTFTGFYSFDSTIVASGVSVPWLGFPSCGPTLRSSDFGNNWTVIDTLLGFSDFINIHDTLFGVRIYTWSQEPPLMMSTDHGITWTPTNHPAIDFGIKRIVARGSEIFTSAGYRSTDLGVKWNPMGAGEWDSAYPLISIAASKSSVFISVNDCSNNSGIYRTRDYGLNWAKVGGYALDVAAVGDSTIFALNGNSITVSTDDGEHWTTTSHPGAESGWDRFTIHGSTVFLGSSSGLLVTTNMGATWFSAGMDSIPVPRIAVSGGYVFAGTSYCSGVDPCLSEIWRAPILSIIPTPPSQWTHIGLEGRSIKDIAYGNNALFAVTADSGSVYRSTDGGNLWEVVFTNSISQVAVAPSSTVFGIKKGSWLTDSLFRSTDNGTTWIQSLAYEYTPEMTTIAIGTSGTILVGQRYDFIGGIQWGIVMRSTDNGLSWSQQDYVPAAEIAFNGLNVVSAGRYGGGAGAGTSPQISISTDDGLSWANGEYELPSPTALVWTHAGIFYGGRDETCCPPETTGGLYFSIDTGKTWEQISSIIPTTLIALPSGKVLASTNGGGLYLFNDDGGSLGTLNDGLTNLNVHTLAMDSLGYVYAGTDSGIFRTSLIDSLIAPSIVQHLNGGWNLLSLPIHPFNHCPSENYPGATSSAFEYSGTYNECNDLCVAKGYWLKLEGNADFQLWGHHTELETVDVSLGWNIIGSLSDPFLASTITSEPAGIVTSSFMEYDGVKYNASDTIKPGKGYWVKVNQAGKLILSTTGNAKASNLIKIVASNEQPPPPPDGEIRNPKSEIPKQFALEQNYPNPFNPRTDIRFTISAEKADRQDARFTSLKIYDVLGREVATLVNEVKQPGEYTISWDAANVPSGIYFYRLTAGRFIETKKLVVMK